MWELRFEAESGARLHRYFWAITTYGDRRWYSEKTGKWGETINGRASTHHGCKTLRAFISHLKNHPELMGQEVVLVNKYDGFDVYANFVPVGVEG